jgi:hypothetical protein
MGEWENRGTEISLRFFLFPFPRFFLTETGPYERLPRSHVSEQP